MEIAYCLSTDSDEYVLNLLENEKSYLRCCPEQIREDVKRKIKWLEKECQRRRLL